MQIVTSSVLEKHEHNCKQFTDGETLPSTSTHRALRLVNRVLSHVVTPHLFRYLSPRDFAFDVDFEGESAVEQLCQSPYAIHVQELRMRPSYKIAMIGRGEILRSLIVRWESIFTQMSAALTSLKELKLLSLHFDSVSWSIDGSTRETWANFIGLLLLRFSKMFPKVQRLWLYLSHNTGSDIIYYKSPELPEDLPVVSALATIPALVVVLEPVPDVQSARFEKHFENSFCFLAVVLPLPIDLDQSSCSAQMRSLLNFVWPFGKDVRGLTISTCEETVLPDCTLSACKNLEEKKRVPQLKDIALRAMFIKDLLWRNCKTLLVMTLQNVYLIDGTWEEILQSTGRLDLMLPKYCVLENLQYASEGTSSIWRDEAVTESKLCSNREADHRALEAFEAMLSRNMDKSIRS